MNKRLNALIGILLLLSAGLACSMLRPKRPLTRHLTLQVKAPVDGRAEVTKQTIAVIETRLGGSGVSNFEVKADGDPANGRILVNLPTTQDAERLARLISEQGKLELVAVVSPPNPELIQTFATQEEAVASLNSGGTVPINRRVLRYAERMELSGDKNNQAPTTQKWVVVESPAIVDGSELRTARAMASRSGGDNYDIQFSLKKTGAEKFGSWTGAHINQYLGIVLNDEVKSIAYIKSQIFDSGEINGRFTKQSAEDLALVLKSGALPFPVMFLEEKFDKPR